MKVTDLGCNDYDRAAWNRWMVKNRLRTIGYEVVENYLRHSPRNYPLPSWIPQGELPVVNERDWQVESRRRGFHDVDD